MRRNRKKYQVGGLLPSSVPYYTQRYPEAFRVAQTSPEQFANVLAAEEGVIRAQNYVNSKEYKNKLYKEWKRSKSSEYPTGQKPSFNELYDERKRRVNETSIKHLNKSPWTYPGNPIIGQNLTYEGAKGRLINKSFVNPIGDLTDVSIENIPLKNKLEEFADLGLEETLHASHVPLNTKSITQSGLGKGTGIKNITPFAQKLLSKTIAKPEEFDFSNKANKAFLTEYATKPTEIIAQFPKLQKEAASRRSLTGKLKNKRFTLKDAESLIQNPTIAGERTFNTLTGKEKPFKAMNRNPKLKKKAKKNLVKLMNNIAYEPTQDEMFYGQEGGSLFPNATSYKQLGASDNTIYYTPSTLTAPVGRPSSINTDRTRIFNCGGHVNTSIKTIDENDMLHPGDSDRLSYRDKPVGLSMSISKVIGPKRNRMAHLINKGNIMPYTQNYKQLGGNIAVTEDDYKQGLNKGKNIFTFPQKGLKKMTMNPPSGDIEYPVDYEDYQDGELINKDTALPGEEFNVQGDTVREVPNLSHMGFNEAIDYANTKKLPIFNWNGDEYPMKHNQKYQEGGLFSSKVTDHTKLNPGFSPDIQ